MFLHHFKEKYEKNMENEVMNTAKFQIFYLQQKCLELLQLKTHQRCQSIKQ